MSTEENEEALQSQKDPFKNIVDQKLFLSIKRNFARKFWKELGRYLGVDEGELNCIEADNPSLELEQAQQMFIAWKQKSAQSATYATLRDVLMKLDRKDLATEVVEYVQKTYCRQPQGTVNTVVTSAETPTTKDSSVAENCDRMAEILRTRYKKLTIKMPPGSTEDEPFSKNYIDMHENYRRSDTKEKETIALDKIFEQHQDENRPTRMLIHGKCGSGKTTTAAKLLYDWSQSKPYIGGLFELVILISGRDCADSIEETLINALSMIFLKKKDVDLLTFLQHLSTRLLLVIDDYERITPKKEEQILAIIRKECLSEATVIIFSRKQKLSTERLESSSISQSRWLGIQNQSFLDRKIEIMPITGKIRDISKNLFVQLQQPALNKRMDLLKCVLTYWNRDNQTYEITPLHLYLLTETLKNATTKNVSLTEVHKRFYKLLVQWELQKEQAITMQTTDTDLLENSMLVVGERIFSIFTGKKPNPLLTDSFVQKYGKKLLDRGLGLPDVEHLKGEMLEEFAAAYYVCRTLLNRTCQQNSDAEASMLLLRPHWGIPNSHCFTFMMNLAEEKRISLLKALHNYSAEYSYSFGGLAQSLMGTQITSDVKESILPLISVEWRIPWICSIQNASNGKCREFHSSDLHEELIVYAVEHAKIKILRWDMQFKASFPKVINVDVLILELKSPLFMQNIESLKTVKCQKVHCILYTVPIENVAECWLKFTTKILSIDFNHISFELKDVSDLWLPLLCEAGTQGRFDGVDIRWVACNLENENQDVTTVTKLIESIDIEGLQLVVCPAGVNRQLDRNNFQDNMNALIHAAANARRLNRLVVINQGQTFSINWSILCQKYHWKWIQFSNVSFQDVKNLPKKSLQIKYLDLEPTEVNETNIANVVEAVKSSQPKVKSLISILAILKKTEDVKSLQTSVKELDVKLDDTDLKEDLSTVLNQFTNLQVLALSMARTSQNTHGKAFNQWLSNSKNCISLLGIEIWGIDANKQLTMTILDNILRAMRKENLSDHKSKRQKTDRFSRQLELGYLLVNAGFSKSDEQNRETLETFVDIALKSRHSIQKQFLPRLDIVCEDLLIQSMCSTKPYGYMSWVDVFPPSKGFTVKHDYWGMSSEDSFRSKAVYDSCPGEYHRFRVTSSAGLM